MKSAFEREFVLLKLFFLFKTSLICKSENTFLQHCVLIKIQKYSLDWDVFSILLSNV